MIAYRIVSAERMEAIKALYRDASWQAYLSDDAKLYRALLNSDYLLGAFDGDEMIGFARCLGDGEHFELMQDLLVKRDYRGKGIGTTLFSMVRKKFERVRFFQINTDREDQQANAFYRKMGMRPIDDGGMIAYTFL